MNYFQDLPELNSRITEKLLVVNTVTTETVVPCIGFYSGHISIRSKYGKPYGATINVIEFVVIVLSNEFLTMPSCEAVFIFL